MRNLAIITARSGSKGLHNKNILELQGKPLMNYTIEAALKSELFNKVFVSTDSEEYANIAESDGAIAHPLRSEELAGDSVGTMAVLLDVLSAFPGYDTFCLLQPTSPFRDAEDIRKAYDIFLQNSASSVVSLSESKKSPKIINQINADGTIHNFLKLNQTNYVRQNEKYFIPNGAIFISDVKKFLQKQDFYQERAYPYIMSKEKSIDIDDELDFLMAEIIMESEELQK